ncbi:GAP family protein [Agromyces atrinae]|uniref:GAP family protein n=1 Tax=Agromyces atrinae TaxID=592376 RepID=UPI001F55E874|nr:GAP family protein [Agromyces atrinae]MCI2959076.1 GAP family protein [Agromyces atrinae]
MLAAFGHVLPLAVAMAFSSVPIMAAILILLSPDRRRAAIPFLAGFVLGLVLVVSVCALVAQSIPEPPARHPDVVVAVAEIVVGAALVLVGVLAWRRSRRSGPSAEPAWMQKIGSLGPIAAFGVAFVLGLRPKALLLAIAVGLAVRGAGLTIEESAVVIVAYSVVAASSVAVPIIVTLASPRRMEPRLVRARAWISGNSGVVTALIALLIGVVIVGAGLARF